MEKRHLNLKFLLIRKGIKNKEIAKVLGMSQTSVSKKINGEAAFKDYELRTLANYLGFKEEDYYHYFFKE